MLCHLPDRDATFFTYVHVVQTIDLVIGFDLSVNEINSSNRSFSLMSRECGSNCDFYICTHARIHFATKYKA